ncbi:transketolase family protein [Faecalicatena contorta]|uniref:transketolase family protein n=1 Tax=Faecalicatena contorta TaxID=39482 RepID=UPI00129D600C|nr:transketolase C-terminal domain-containing protein [Faecalicatena contorta]MRM88535.1 transketolase family protein [Faecalicatena contorta]
MFENKEMRAVMADWIKEKMAEDEKLVILDADLARANGTLEIRKEFPERALDVGVAESNMASVGAGLASYGYKPFIFTFCPFATRRICDQVTISIVYAKRNVKIVGTDPGIAAAFNGGTHMTQEDVGVMRSIPGMVIFEPVDGDQLAKALPQIYEYDGPVYIRLFRKAAPKTFFHNEDYKFDLFKADIMKEGRDVTLFASGIEVKEAMEAAELLASEGIQAEVVNVHTIKPIDRETVVNSVKKTGCAVSCENHNIIGGLGAAIAEVLAEEYPVPMEYIGTKDFFSEVGKTDYLVTKYHMDAASIAEAAKKSIGKKGR